MNSGYNSLDYRFVVNVRYDRQMNKEDLSADWIMD